MRTCVSSCFALLATLATLACSSASSPERQEVPGDTDGGPSGSGGNTTNSSTNFGFTTNNGTVTGGDPPDPCEAEDAPDDCKLMPSGPACGDGAINLDPPEPCDDGNSLPGDGCSGTCVIEAYHECPTPGELCVSTIICGDGSVGPGEACDDGNTNASDGCSSECNLVELGFRCPREGGACEKVPFCGDGITDSNEGCDDANGDANDGCGTDCRLELGFKCEGEPSACTATDCGDMVQEGAESCDDGNATPFDGCSSICRAEPNCRDGACSSSCGDGIVLNEDCDDGNLRNGDGCSSECTVESGFVCSNEVPPCVEGEPCTLVVPIVYRDFNDTHTDFQPPYNGPPDGVPGLVQDRLDAEGKPVATTNAMILDDGYVTSAASFADWYRDEPVNHTIVGELVLWDNDNGGFVNRWGENGEQWLGEENPVVWTNITRCGNAGDGCGEDTECLDMIPAGGECYDPCEPWNETATNANNSCTGVRTQAAQDAYDGSPLFFPIDNHPDALTTPADYYEAQVTPQYGYNWVMEDDIFPGAPLHNFHFTSEVHYWFQYNAGETVKLDFTGDDDVWVFVNSTLAVDLGGWHIPLSGSVTVNAQSANTYDLEDGSVYEIAIFQAERQTSGSSYRLTLSGFNLTPSYCTGDCGDGEVGPGEECDDGMNDGGYEECAPGCLLGPTCGDAIVQEPYAELCDDGINDGSYGGCAPDCGLGPHCGDAVVQNDHEQCDDGVNDSGYGECAPGCVLGPYCGDGNVTLGFEECDDSANEDGDGCSAACKIEIIIPE